MKGDPNRRRILIVGKERSARDTMRILLGSTGCECMVASNVQQALATIEQKDFDAVVLDPKSSSSPAAEVISKICEVAPNLLERVVVITDEDSDPETKNLVERYSLPYVQRKFLLQQLCAHLESLFRPEAVFQNVTQLARPIFDSFRNPLTAGVRASYVRSRQLLYASGSIRVDLWIEPQADSSRIALAGQLLDSARPDRRFDSVPVALRDRKGPVAHATTNEFGEFHFDFDSEPTTISVEIRIAETQCITVPLPALGKGRQKAAGYS